MSIKQKDVWQNVGNAPCTFKLTNRWRWMSGFTNKALHSNEKIFQSLSGFHNVSLVSHSDSLVTMFWEVKTSHYVLFFDSQFHTPQALLLHLPVSSDQAHPTAWFCLPLQQKIGLHELPFPWHDGPSGHVQRILTQQHCPVTTENSLCEL